MNPRFRFGLGLFSLLFALLLALGPAENRVCCGQVAEEGKAAPKPDEAETPSFEGIWHASYRNHLSAETLFFEFIKKPDGSLRAIFDSPDSKVHVPLDVVKMEGKLAKVHLNNGALFLELTLGDTNALAQGKIHAQGKVLTFPFRRMDKKPEYRRPQEPMKPYPYQEEEVTIANAKAKIQLAGTLTIPPGDGPHPAVLLVTGSGPETRNNTGGGHHYFLVLADFLTRQGIMVLRVDDRGVGKSTGRFDQVTSEVSSQDAECCVAFLKGRPEVDAKRIGLVGHSDGVQTSSHLAARSSDIAFVVMMGGQGVKGEKFVIKQSEDGYRALGQNPALVEFQLEMQRTVAKIVTEELDDAKAQAQITQMEEDFAAKLTDDYRKKLGVDKSFFVGKTIGSPKFLRFFMTNDPSVAIRKVKCPVLAIGGSKDLIVSSNENLAAIEAALKAGGNPDYTVKQFPKLNHMMQTCEIGAPWEYLHLEETMSPMAMGFVADWIKEHVK